MKHPYKDYEKTDEWQSIKLAIHNLIENNDIELLTREEYVIGFICKILFQNKKQDK